MLVFFFFPKKVLLTLLLWLFHLSRTLGMIYKDAPRQPYLKCNKICPSCQYFQLMVTFVKTVLLIFFSKCLHLTRISVQAVSSSTHFCQNIVYCSEAFMYLSMYILTIFFSFNRGNFKCYLDMGLGHIQLNMVLFFQICQYFPAIFVFLWLNPCFFHIMVMKCMSVCNLTIYSTGGDILVIGLENGHERKKILYVSYNGFERWVFVCNLKSA